MSERQYKLTWTAKGTITVTSESRAEAMELAEDILYNDLDAADSDEFEVTEAEAS
jgi:hypothetical protein